MPGQEDLTDDRELAENLETLVEDASIKELRHIKMVKVIDLKMRGVSELGCIRDQANLTLRKQCQRSNGDLPSSRRTVRELARPFLMNPVLRGPGSLFFQDQAGNFSGTRGSGG